MGRKKFNKIAAGLLFVPWCAYAKTGPAEAPATVNLGSASGFAVLAASGVFNTESSEVYGDVGVTHGSAIFGFPPGRVYRGTIREGGPVDKAQEDAEVVFRRLRDLSSFPVASDIGRNLGGLKLLPGIYAFDASVRLNGTLRLDAQSRDRAVFVFQIGNDLTTGQNAKVLLTNGKPGDEVYWEVGGSATLGMGTAFRGNILARNSVDLGLGATVSCGRAFSLDGAVTMDNDSVSIDCGQRQAAVTSLVPVFGGKPNADPSPNRVVASPEPASFWLGSAGLVALGAVWLARVWRLR